MKILKIFQIKMMNLNKETKKEKNNIEETKEETIIFKNKIDIEKELFDEFNNNYEPETKLNINTLESNKDEPENKKLPDVSIDEYMKNFNASEFKESEINSLFNEDDIFPNIPI